MSFTQAGVLPLEAGMALVLGANLGSALNRCWKARATARRRGAGCARQPPDPARRLRRRPALPRLIGPHSRHLAAGLSRAVADFHTAFNLVLALVFPAGAHPLRGLLRRLVPERIDAHDPVGRSTRRGRARDAAVALGAAGREALRMADVLAEMMAGAGEALTGGDRAKVAQIRRIDDTLDRLNAAIKAYLVASTPNP